MDNQYKIPLPNDMDEIDRKIIEALQIDGRTAFAQIAQQLNVSPGMIRIRYNRLVELGFIQIIAITNPLNVGYNAMALIGIRVEGSKLLQAADLLATMQEVVYLVITSGRYDIMIEVMCTDQEDLLHFIVEKLSKVDGVKDSETFRHLKIKKEIYI